MQNITQQKTALAMTVYIKIIQNIIQSFILSSNVIPLTSKMYYRNYRTATVFKYNTTPI